MTATLKVITDAKSSYCIVYETNCGEVVFEGSTITPKQLFHILESTNGSCDDVKYYELTNNQLEDWQEHV